MLINKTVLYQHWNKSLGSLEKRQEMEENNFPKDKPKEQIKTWN